ncbi:Acetolactate synthase isozyme 1 large subunit [bioreactor metagenome]|uniref:acetolactate synthase n=1 Tax=bioreactor metagenome TaxID=1076179 RepID=A0A644SZC3_9ZZZZ|nr:acetolactate synthase large subunit [Desulfovibrio desulfuricans]MEA4990486.1 acetolactate synthase large subunit [Desulfovibrio desulfuricans]
MLRLTGAELTIRLLENQGVTHIAGIPGGFNLPLYDALGRSGTIRHILARHEQGAGFIAQGMARVTGRPGVIFATSGPGATNTLTALADARMDSVPLVCITGQVPLSMIGTDAFQEVDIYGMSIPATKHNFIVRSIDELLRVIPEAFAIAAGDRPGPVLVDIPRDVQVAVAELQDLPAAGTPAPMPQPDPQALARAAEMMNTAKRPLLLLGGGTSSPEASAAVVSFMEARRIPAVMSLRGLGTVPHGHELAVGMLGMHGARASNMLVDECDLLMVVGARLGDRATGRLDGFCPKTGLIHIDIDACEVGKLRIPQVGITADAAEALTALLPLLRKTDHEPWLERVAACKAEHGLRFDRTDEVCSPYGIIRHVADALHGTGIVSTDVGQHQMRVAQAYPMMQPRQWLTSGGLGTMGFGLPAAIGAALAKPEETVVCFSGDGSLLMNIQEMATAVENQANVKIILCNNDGLGLVQQQQDLFFGGRLFGSTFTAGTDFVRIAQGFGMPAICLNNERDPRVVLEKALGTPGPCLLEVRMSAEEKVFPMVPPGAANSQMIEGVNA